MIDGETLAAWNFQPMRVETELLHDGRMDVSDVMAVFDGVEAEFVGGAVDDAPFDAAAGEPDGEAVDVMIAAVASLLTGGPAEFGREDHDGSR